MKMANKNEKAGRQPVTDCNRLGNAAKMREEQYHDCLALRTIVRELDEGMEVLNLRDTLAAMADRMESALSSPPRNCDRPECATTKAAQEVWRREDGGKTAYYEWLLATSTKGEAK